MKELRGFMGEKKTDDEKVYLETPKLISNGLCAYGVRKKGASHILKEMPCQDAILMLAINDYISAYVVCDGHGDYRHKYSEDGSRFATEAVVDTVKVTVSECEDQNLTEKEIEKKLKKSNENYEMRCRIMDLWKSKVKDDYRHAKRCERNLSDRDIYTLYGTTILYVIVTPNYYLVGQVGDGAILLYNSLNDYEIFDRSGMKESEATYSLCTEFCEFRHFNTGTYNRDYNGFMLSTDGVFDRYESINEKSQGMGFATAYHTLTDNLCRVGEDKLMSILTSDRFYKGITDDCTLIVAIGTGKHSRDINKELFNRRDRADIGQIEEHHLNYVQANYIETETVVQLGDSSLSDKMIDKEEIPEEVNMFFPAFIKTENIEGTVIITNNDKRFQTYRSLQTMTMRGWLNMSSSREAVNAFANKINEICEVLSRIEYVPTEDFGASIFVNPYGEIMFLPTAFAKKNSADDNSADDVFDMSFFLGSLHINEFINHWKLLGIPMSR
ncbi:MAG: protein phosphatase 2C domain-containing protein [Eubacterium sp.]|nr:protein phosphatase 2C domain-containing protein [Eubacterium sp.]